MFFRKYKRVIIAILAVLLAALMVIPTLASVLMASAVELSSDELAETRKAIGQQLDAVGGELSGLQGDADGINQQMDALMAMLDENANETKTIVQQKYELDQKIELLRQQVENTNLQIQEYNKLIAARQSELDIAIGQEEAQNEKYRERIRSMEESGSVSYLSILFNASSFTDLLDRIDMIKEVAESDQRVLEQMTIARQEVVDAQEALETEKAALNETKQLLASQQAELDTQRADANALISSLGFEAENYKDEYSVYEEQEAALQESILAKLAQYEAVQAEYNAALAEEQEALAREEEARRKAAAEEAARQAAAAAAAAASGATSASSNDTGSDSAYYVTGEASESGFMCPVPTYTVTDAFGYRIHPITGSNSFHTGVDLACNSGTNIYATKSGNVVEAGYDSAYGNYVLISHGSGQSSMYGHMSSQTVSTGDYVVQGQTIGYVGSTGWSTGPHLHFEIIINGEYVNPMGYIG